MAKIIVVANGKGGTGKSTLCIHIANYLTSLGKAVAVLDADEGQTIVKMRRIHDHSRRILPFADVGLRPEIAGSSLSLGR